MCTNLYFSLTVTAKSSLLPKPGHKQQLGMTAYNQIQKISTEYNEWKLFN